MYPGEFHPDSMNVAKAIKQDVLKFSSLYSKFNNLRFITSVMINTDEKTKCHYVQGVVQDLYAGSAAGRYFDRACMNTTVPKEKHRVQIRSE